MDKRALLGFVALFGWLACSSDDAIRYLREPINTSQVDATSIVGGGTETQVARVPSVIVNGRPIGDTMVYAYNLAAWSVSSDIQSSLNPTFPVQAREATSPFVTAMQAPLMCDGSRYASSAGDPALVATGWPGQVAYISLGISANQTMTGNPTDIVAAVSNDGGRTFGPASGGTFGVNGAFAVISTQQSSACDSPNPTPFIDQPVAYAEQSGTHVVWAMWVNRNSAFNGGGKRPWVRRLHFNAAGAIDQMGSATEVRIDCNLSCVRFDTFKLAAACDSAHATLDNCGIGSANPGSETLVVTFPRVNEGGETQLISAQAARTCTQTISLEWRAAISSDGGSTWKQGVSGSNGSIIVDNDPIWKNCIVPNARANNGNNRGHVPVFHDDVFNRWHLYYTKTTLNGFGGAISGQRIFHAALDDNFNYVAAREEVAPVKIIYGTSNPCSTMDPNAECLVEQFVPAGAWLNVSPSSTFHAVTWHDTRRNTTTPRGTIWGAFSCLQGQTGSFRNQELASGRGVPWAFTGTNGNTPWGDYEGMAADLTGIPTFYPAWADNRLGGTASRVFARGWSPDCAQ